jgi:hypothetical protein
MKERSFMNRLEAKDDQRRREQSQERSLRPAAIPSGLVLREDAVIYVKNRWGPAITTSMLERLLDEERGPPPITIDTHTYYSYADVDMWVYRTFSGVPAGWREVAGRISTVPVRQLEKLSASDKAHLPIAFIRRAEIGEQRHGEEPSNGGTGRKEDGRGGD